jgi:acetate kinase
MKVLVFNCGSSSLSYKIFDALDSEHAEVILSGKAHRVGVKSQEPSFLEFHFQGEERRDVVLLENHRQAAVLVLQFVKWKKIEIDLVGHRFVHGGSFFDGSAILNENTLKKLEACLPLAPLHNPISLSVILESLESLPDIPQYATFDSAFHSSIPTYAYTYALPRPVAEKYGFRKYGFHGLSYAYVTREAARFLGIPLDRLKLVACHLGTGGSSVAAIRNGRSIDTSMGYSPLPGLVMSTRSGDVDPMLSVYLMATYGYHPDELVELFNGQSGLLGLSGYTSDIRDIIKRLSEGDERAELAFEMYVQRVKKYIGSYVLELEGMDVLVFTDDIGVHNWLVREKICADMEWCGLILDQELNHQATDGTIADVSAAQSRVRVLVVPTEEERVICLDGLRLSGMSDDSAN